MTLEQRIQQKIKENEQSFELFPGVVVIHHLHTQTVLYMSRLGREGLNVTNEDLQAMGLDYHRKFFNPEEAQEYVPKILGLLERNNSEEFVSFFQQVRVAENAEYKWWLSSIRIFMQDDNGAPVATITVSVPVDPEHNFATKIERLLQENNFLRKNGELFASLTRREKQILAMMARDKTSIEISEQLFLAEDTVKTHRRNIKKKINAQNQYDVIKFAQAFDII